MKKEKIYNLMLYLIIFCAILSIILIKPIDNLDELWNYNFARNIANGLIPYKDFNMVITPLLSIVCGFILKITFNELIIMRILAALLCASIIYITYKLLVMLGIKKELSFIFTFLLVILFEDLFCIDYNYATLLIVLFIIYKEIKAYKKENEFIKNNIKNDLFLGILAGLTITLKQTTGIFVCVALLGNKMLFIKNKEEFKIYLKSFSFRLIGIIIPISLMFWYLINKNALQEFINYTIKGVSDFSNYIPYNNIISFDIIGILSILVPLTFVFEWVKTIILEREKESYIFMVYGLAMFVVCFPISDQIHFLIGSLPTIILILYECYKLLRRIYYKTIKEKKTEKFMYGILIFFFTWTTLVISCYSVFNFYKYFKNNYYSKLKYYKNIPISKELENQIIIINNYINSVNTDVKILDASAATYMIPNNRYNKDYDMLNKGNFGEDGENKLIKDIEKNKNTQYLILNNKYEKNWQTPINIIEYVINNKKKIGEISIFDIYE